MRIIGWTWWGDPQYKGMHEWDFSTWEEVDEREQIVVKELRDNEYKFTGDYHQNGEYGVPIFDDGTLLLCSQRQWGALMARAYPDEIDNSDGMGYCVWAWLPPAPMTIPEEEK